MTLTPVIQEYKGLEQLDYEIIYQENIERITREIFFPEQYYLYGDTNEKIRN